jgi:GT2 family glycosyltransferase
VRVLVIDNASADGTVAAARAAGAEVIANAENRGFAGAVNQGFRATKTELVLVMNPDVRLRSRLDRLEAAALKHGVAGGALTDGAGRFQQGFTIRRFPTALTLALELLGVNRLWPANPWNRAYRYLDRDLSQAGPAEQPAGAFLMIRRDVWEGLGGWDEAFWPMWFEDVDFCRRAAAAGLAIWYEPGARAEHLGGHSIGKIPEACRQLHWYDRLLRYAGKHLPAGRYRLLCLAGAVGAGLRAAVAVARERSLRPVGNYWKILNFLGRRLVSRPPGGDN